MASEWVLIQQCLRLSGSCKSSEAWFLLPCAPPSQLHPFFSKPKPAQTDELHYVFNTSGICHISQYLPKIYSHGTKGCLFFLRKCCIFKCILTFLYLTWKCKHSALEHFLITYSSRMTLFILKELQLILDKNIKRVTRSLNIMRKHWKALGDGRSRSDTPNDITYNTSRNESNSIFSNPVDTDQT